MRAFLIALGVALVATPLARLLALRLGILDRPSERKLQAKPVPYLGGAAIVAGTLSGAWLTIGWQPVAAAAVVAAMGLVDDVRGVSGWVKALVIVPLAFWMWSLTVFGVHWTGIGWLDFALTMGWYCGITNAVNFLDNADGLMAGTLAIAMGVLALFGDPTSAALAGACLGFLAYNRAPAKVYSGDLGSGWVGFLGAAAALQLQSRTDFLVAVIALGVPITDTLMISVSRVLRGLSPLHPGRDHVSHRLVRAGLSKPVAVAMLWGLGLVFAVLAWVAARGTTLIAFVIAAALGVGVAAFALRSPATDEPTPEGRAGQGVAG